ncbi:hypothetical protein CEE45_03505 [Candidatus Heimdallarchaeota archaeon B3_Heim]|nr:MAG: hypothetical protein CEE45_03505 [Candidatus Heimdallarchaeota archaeon B3_Heim]
MIVYIKSRDGYEKVGSPYTFIQYDKDILNVKTESELITLLDSKDEHYMYVIPRIFIESVIIPKWEYKKEVERTHIYPIVSWYVSEERNFYITAIVDDDYENMLYDCLGENYREGLAITWKYKPSLLHELVWMSHSGAYRKWEWESKPQIPIALLNSQCWIMFYNAHDRDLANYPYFEEIKSGITQGLEEKAIFDSIGEQRKKYFEKLIAEW